MTVSWVGAFGQLRASLSTELPADLRPFHWSATGWMAKLWYGNRAIHYEIWVRQSAKVVELGLHFEADALTNARLIGAFRARAREVRRALGETARIEEWDKGWTRVWEPCSLREDDVSRRVRERFPLYVRMLEPMLREELPADVAWDPPVPRVTSSRASRSSR